MIRTPRVASETSSPIGLRRLVSGVGSGRHADKLSRLPRNPFRRQIGRVVDGVGCKHQSSRARVRRLRLACMLSLSTAFRITSQVLARRYHESLTAWRRTAAAPSEGQEGSEYEPRRWHPFVRGIAAATLSGSTLRGVAKTAWPSGVRRRLQPLVHKGVASDSRAVGHDGRRRAKATPLIYLGQAGRCRDNLVEWTKALLHAAIGRSGRCAGTKRQAAEWSALWPRSCNLCCWRTLRTTSVHGTLPPFTETSWPQTAEGVDASTNPQGREFDPLPRHPTQPHSSRAWSRPPLRQERLSNISRDAATSAYPAGLPVRLRGGGAHGALS